MKSNFGNNLIFFLSEISNLKFLIFFNYKNFLFISEPFLDKLSKDKSLNIEFFKKYINLNRQNQYPPVIKIFIFFEYINDIKFSYEVFYINSL